jgi:hypothetical protein
MSVDPTAYPAGSLAHARGRDWVVLPAEVPAVVRLRPLHGRADEGPGIFLPLEGLTPRTAVQRAMDGGERDETIQSPPPRDQRAPRAPDVPDGGRGELAGWRR